MNDVHSNTTKSENGEGLGMRVLSSIVLLILFALAETALWVMAILQIVLRTVNGERNASIADFGAKLSSWARHAIQYLTGVSEDRPFPWDEARD